MLPVTSGGPDRFLRGSQWRFTENNKLSITLIDDPEELICDYSYDEQTKTITSTVEGEEFAKFIVTNLTNNNMSLDITDLFGLAEGVRCDSIFVRK